MSIWPATVVPSVLSSDELERWRSVGPSSLANQSRGTTAIPNAETVAERLGHDSVQTTLTLYGHVARTMRPDLTVPARSERRG
jgi:integrase